MQISIGVALTAPVVGAVRAPVLGPELIVSGDGSSTAGWTGNNATLSIVDGELRVTSTIANGNPSAYQAVSVTPGASYSLSGKATRRSATTVAARIGAYDTPPTIAPILGTSTSSATTDVPVEGSTTIVGPADGVLSIACLLLTNTAIGSYGDFDNVSLRQIL